MDSIKNLFIVGPGPSSSHTIGPSKAAIDFIKDIKKVDKIVVTLYGSLALTGRGHFTDKAIQNSLKDIETEVYFDLEKKNLKHPNTMIFKAYLNEKEIKNQTYYSIGGGQIVTDLKKDCKKAIYKLNHFSDINAYISRMNMSLVDYVNENEDNSLDKYLEQTLDFMFKEVENNLKKEGRIPGPLGLIRVAKKIYEDAINEQNNESKLMLISAFAYACLEGNASGDIVVTAPTCGSCGILPAVLYYEYHFNHKDKKTLIDGLKVAGIFGNICKENASISGAVLGCQAEVGVATAMATAALCYINLLSTEQIEYGAEVALEHFLGLTCDPVLGYVQIPCIERNGIGAMRAYESFLYAKNIAPIRKNKVSFDKVVEAMRLTGNSLNADYKETSRGGLASIIK